MILLAPVIGSLLLIATMAVCVRLTGAVGAMGSRRFWYFSIGFTAWGPLLLLALSSEIDRATDPSLSVTYIFLVTASALSVMVITLCGVSVRASLLAAGAALLFATLEINVAALFSNQSLPATLFAGGVGVVFAWNAGVAAVLAPAALLERRRNFRASRGQCVACGYDLSSVSRSHVCPECGEAFRAPLVWDMPIQESFEDE